MASLRDWRKRIVAIMAALLFLVTSLGFSFLVIYQIHKDNQQNKANAGLQEALKQAQAKQQTPTTADKKEGKLEGTQLQGFTPVVSVSTLSSTDTVVGTGDTVQAGDTITAHYTGALASTGVIFQSSLDSGQPFTSPLSGLIKGWQEGIPGMKVGGTRRLMIPAAQAYGSQSQSGIPANSDLVFDIQLIRVGN